MGGGSREGQRAPLVNPGFTSEDRISVGMTRIELSVSKLSKQLCGTKSLIQGPVSQDQTTTILFFRRRCVVLKFQDQRMTK